MQENPPAGLLAWIINVIAEKAPRGAFGVNIYAVNYDIVTINMLSKHHFRGKACLKTYSDVPNQVLTFSTQDTQLALG
jgi:hypothetical protein